MHRSLSHLVVTWMVVSVMGGVLLYQAPMSTGESDPDIVFLDANGDVVEDVNYTSSYNSTSHALKVVVNTNVSLSLLLNASWVDVLVPDVALENTSFSAYGWQSSSWFRVELNRSGVTFVDLHPFQPLTDRAVFSCGSASSILLERPMFIRLEAVPTVTVAQHIDSNSNGTWSYADAMTSGPLVLNLTDQNTTGQTVRLNASWLTSYGIAQPSFLLSGGEDIPFNKTSDAYLLSPPHFSFIYVFAFYEHFRKETDYPNSEIYWDQALQKIALTSDRRDTGDEWFSRFLPQEIDSTKDFVISSLWTPTIRGNWQIAVPLFIASSRNTGALQPSGIYFMYSSRDNIPPPGCRWCNPAYYLYYIDRAGVTRIGTFFEGQAYVAYKFFAIYSATTRVLTLQIRSTADVVLAYGYYTIGTYSNDGFFFGKIGAGTRGYSSTQEPVCQGTVDNVQLTLGSVVNPSVELDVNGDGVPDGWRNVWYFASRSYGTSHSGEWSIRIHDTQINNGGGMETDDMPGTPGRYYRAVAYARINSGSFQLSMKFLDAGQVQIGGPTTIVGTTDTYWRRIYVDGVAPPGTATIRIIAWSTNANVGIAYFDSFYLVDSMAENAGFEEVAGGAPAHWTGVNGAIPRVSGTHVRTGSYSLQLQDWSGSPPTLGVRSDWLPCVSGARYRAAGWVFVESTSEGGNGYPFSLTLGFTGGGGGLFYVDGGAIGRWDYLAVEAIAPSSCTYIYVQFISSWANMGIAYLDDVELLLAPSGLETDSSVWAMTVHETPGSPDSLGSTSDLGAGHERRDWMWMSMQPDRVDAYNWDYFADRRTYIRSANLVGIDILVIVGGSLGVSGYVPSWVTTENFASAWHAFCARVGREFGAAVYWYQLANEQNWIGGPYDDLAVFNECFAGLLETDSSSAQTSHTWFFRSIVNAATYGPGNWHRDLTDWLGGAGSSIDVVAIDHYPDEWPLGPPDQDWSDLEDLGDIAVQYGKLAAVMETGRSTYPPCDEICQADWVWNNIQDHLRPIASAHNTAHHNNRFVLLGWYKLRDKTGESKPWGLMTQGGVHKMAYAAFRSEAIWYDGPPFFS